MASMVVVYDGLKDILGRWFGTWSTDFFVFLFSDNPGSLLKTDNYASRTEITTPSGIDRQQLLGSAFGAPTIVGTQVQAAAPGMVFQPVSSSGLPVTAYGFCLVDMSDTKLILEQKLDNPFTFNTTADKLTITPVMTDDDL